MFEHSRIFSNRNLHTGHMQWYYETREGVMGPFDSKGLAMEALERHIVYAKQHHLDGGRTLGLDGGKEFKFQ
jgi:hypothetical protein